MPKFKQKCSRCRTNFVLVSRMSNWVECDECQAAVLSKEITDPEMKKLFDIPEEFYEKNRFLKSIKINYLKFGKLSERQIETFKKVVKDMEEEAKKKE